jgi:hypothetical protein
MLEYLSKRGERKGKERYIQKLTKRIRKSIKTQKE